MQATPHIVMLIDAWFPFVGGGQIHVEQLSKTLEDKHGCRVTILHAPNPSTPARLIWSMLVIVQLLLLRPKPTIIHSHGFLPGLPAKIASQLLHLPVVHTVHGSHLMDQQSSGIKTRLEKYLLTQIKYSALITVSNTFTQYPNINTNIHTIRNGVDLKLFDSVVVAKHSRPTVLCVARDHPHKGIIYLQQAMTQVRQVIPSAQLKWIKGELSGRSLVKAYKRAHVFALPSLAEGQPITLLEAWAARLPVVVTRVGDNPHLVTPHTGYLIDPQNSDQLASTIIKLLHSPKLRQQLGHHGHQLVKSNYTWNHIAAQTYQLYMTLIPTP